ncbi:MAG: hypothetical protein E6Q46_02550 [Flavobacterium sp.]|nr:MAG: hypothetical protein E6Q46_02550 [Flavobacterium sp.]
MIILVNSKTHLKYKVILALNEAKSIIPSIKWIKDDMYLFNSENDVLSKKEISKILEKNPNLDFFKSDNFFEIDNANCKDFLISDFNYVRSILPQKGVSPLIGVQIKPINNRPTFLHRGSNFVWYQEYGLFEVLNNNNSIGFYNFESKCLVLKKINQFDKYIEKINSINSSLISHMENKKDERYVRVISVYSKKTGELKYRILNEEFNYNSFALFNLEPIDGDLNFLKSYEMTKSLAVEYLDWSYLEIDFDFDINDYFFETLKSETLTYSQEDIFKT